MGGNFESFCHQARARVTSLVTGTHGGLVRWVGGAARGPALSANSLARQQEETVTGITPPVVSSLVHATDEELVAGVMCASEVHFTQLYDRFFPRVFGFVYNRVRDNADVEEIVQDTFSAVFESMGSYRGQSSLLSWIFGIARNTANNALRRKKIRDQYVDQTLPESVHEAAGDANRSPEELLHMRRFVDAFYERLESVSEWQSDIFRMRHLEDLSIREICERTERSSDAVRSSLYRVKNLLIQGTGSRGNAVRSENSE